MSIERKLVFGALGLWLAVAAVVHGCAHGPTAPPLPPMPTDPTQPAMPTLGGYDDSHDCWTAGCFYGVHFDADGGVVYACGEKVHPPCDGGVDGP